MLLLQPIEFPFRSKMSGTATTLTLLHGLLSDAGLKEWDYKPIMPHYMTFCTIDGRNECFAEALVMQEFDILTSSTTRGRSTQMLVHCHINHFKAI